MRAIRCSGLSAGNYGIKNDIHIWIVLSGFFFCEIKSKWPKIAKKSVCVLVSFYYHSTSGIRGRYLLTIVFDVTTQNLDLTKEMISRLLEYIELGNPSVNLILATLADGPNSIGRFDESASMLKVRNFLERMPNRDYPYFDAVLAYKKVESDFLFTPSESSDIAMFITDKPLLLRNFALTKTFFSTKAQTSNVQMMYVGLGSSVNPDMTLMLSNFKVAHRIIVSKEALVTSGLNNIVRAVGTGKYWKLKKTQFLEIFFFS
jgi:hypothetical protein